MLNDIHKDINYLSSAPFFDIGINTWKVPLLSISMILVSINYKNKFLFAFKNGNNNIPIFFHKTRMININNTVNDNTKLLKNLYKKKTRSRKSKIQQKTKSIMQIDKYLILCDVKNPNTETNKYIANLSKAYGSENFYPVLIYPSDITVLSYYTNKTLPFKTLLKPLGNKHEFKFIL
jgi:hypothetical protein